MLPDYIDQSAPYRFTANKSRGFHVGFFQFAPDGSERPVAQHWLRECGDERSLRAMLRWLSVRREMWQDWGKLAQAEGPEAFDGHLAQLMEAEPVEEPVGTLVAKQQDPRDLAIGDQLATTDGVRNEILYVHRFQSADARNQFFDWFVTDRNSDQAELLLNIAKSDGTVALGQALDELAQGATQNPQ